MRVAGERTRAIVLANPLNPMTTVLDRVSCETIATVAARHDLLVINDEAFADHVFGTGVVGTLDAARIAIVSPQSSAVSPPPSHHCAND